MTTRVFAIYDKIAAAFQPVFCVPSVGQAERAFHDACSVPDSDLGKHPSDYDLYQVGVFNQESGDIVAEKVFITNGGNQ